MVCWEYLSWLFCQLDTRVMQFPSFWSANLWGVPATNSHHCELHHALSVMVDYPQTVSQNKSLPQPPFTHTDSLTIEHLGSMLWSVSAILLFLSGLALNECVNNLKIFFSNLTRVYIVYCSVSESSNISIFPIFVICINLNVYGCNNSLSAGYNNSYSLNCFLK